MPTQVQGLTSGAIAIAVGDNAACAIVHGGLTCWGDNTYGQLCNSSTTSSTVPVSSITWANSLATLVAGSEHFCANSRFQGTVCWGRNDEGQLGNGSTTDSTTPGPFSSIPSAITQIVAGAKHTCVSLDGAPYCWGRNNEGQLGDGTLTDRLGPVAVDGLTNVRSLIAGRSHSCAYTSAGLKCWGDNSYGQLGIGSTTGSTGPVAVTGTLANAPFVSSSGGDHTCVVKQGTLRCWGRNDSGQLANGTMTNATVPTEATGFTGSCVPASCGSLGLDCGVTADLCGGSLTCGSCSSPEVCGGGGTSNVCGGCVSTTCAAEGVRCGLAYDATCSNTINCGACSAANSCED